MRGRVLRGMVQVALAIVVVCVSAGCGRQAAVDHGQRGGVSEAARVAISRVIGSSEPQYRIDSQLRTATAGVHAEFSATGARIHSGGVTWTLAAPGVRPLSIGNRVTYATTRFREWFVSGPLGLEQGYTITRPVAGAILTLPVGKLPAGVGVQFAAGAHDANLVRGGQVVLGYRDLTVVDHSGRTLPARIVLEGRDRLAIRVQVSGAHYPVIVDPLIQATKLSLATTGDGLGSEGALAVSGDTIAAGAWQYPSGAKNGAVFVFTKPAGGWAATTTYTARLTNGNTTGDYLGQSVAIDGNTIVAGAQGTHGYADVFIEPPGGWATTATATAVLSDSTISSDSGFGKAVGISGGTIAVGDPAYSGAHGLVDVFVRPGGGWASSTAPTERLTDSTASGAIEGALGTSVAVSGSTIAAGAPSWKPSVNATQTGVVLEFTAPSGGWGAGGVTAANQTATLTPGSATYYGDPVLGTSVAIDGPVIVAGASDWQSGSSTPATGAAYLWAEGAGGWVDAAQTAVLTPSDGVASGNFGTSVGVSGSSVVVGAPDAGVNDAGAVYLFRQPAGGWINATQTQELSAGDPSTNAELGISAAVNGDTVAAATYAATSGSVYVFGDASLSITTSTLVSATSGTPYSAVIAAGGGTPPLIFSASGLPAGLTINPSTGAITGTPTAVGAGTPSFTVTDAYGSSVSAQIGLTVFAAPVTTSTTPTTAPTTLANLTPPQINGTFKAKHNLTCTPGTWTPAGATYKYAWFAIQPAPVTPKLTIKTKSKTFGLKGSPSLIAARLHTVVPHDVSTLIVTGPTYAVGYLAAPQSIYCQVTASSGTQSASANSAAATVNPGPPQLAGPTKADPLPAKPHIVPGVGVGGHNPCTSGDWLGGPTFSYAWVAVSKPAGKVLAHFGSGPSLTVPGEAEDRLLQCKVTATNKWGSASAWSNSYLVPQSAPQSNATPQVDITTRDPSSQVVAGAAGAAGIAEIIDLKCLPDGWNRDDLSYSYTWTDDRWGTTQSGQQLLLDMRPGNLQYDEGIHCQVTAKTSHGLSNTAQSGPITVWNGCTEYYSDAEQADSPVDTHIGPPFEWLEAVPADDLFIDDQGSGPVVSGDFGLAGGGLELDNPFFRGTVRASRAETDGPNCEDYQKYLQGQGYDVKQGPNPDGDPTWVEDGNPYF